MKLTIVFVLFVLCVHRVYTFGNFVQPIICIRFIPILAEKYVREFKLQNAGWVYPVPESLDEVELNTYYTSCFQPRNSTGASGYMGFQNIDRDIHVRRGTKDIYIRWNTKGWPVARCEAQMGSCHCNPVSSTYKGYTSYICTDN